MRRASRSYVATRLHCSRKHLRRELPERSLARIEEAMVWARQQKYDFALTGSVEEWRYKVGVDGEPAVGIAVSIIDVPTGETLWSGVGAKAGWSRDSLAAVAQQLMRKLIGDGLSARKD